MTPITKAFSVFDCDAHLTETPEIWNHLTADEREAVKPWYWAEGDYLIVNGSKISPGVWAIGRCGDTDGYHTERRRVPNRVECVGPGYTKRHVRKLYSMKLTDQQCDYVDQRGARDPDARMADMDQQGIDQVVVIPLSMLSGFNNVGNHDAAALMARAYNDWVKDWCSAGPQRLFPAAVLPLVSPVRSAKELQRSAANGFRVAMVRPIPIHGVYPLGGAFAPLWDAFCDSGLVVGMHTLGGPGTPWGDLLDRAADRDQMPGPAPTRCLGFVHEAMIWVATMLLSGLLERYPRLPPMAIMESNATWLPMLLEECDLAVQGRSGQTPVNLQRLPSQTFRDRCFIAFEGDEQPVFRQASFFEDIAIWSSDLPHLDGADAWTAIRTMQAMGVSQSMQAKLLGGNARRMYGIEPGLFATSKPESYSPRPEWFPTDKELDLEYADRTRPR